MKVLHVVPSFWPAYVYGGPIRSCKELCRNLASFGCDVRVLTTDSNGLRSSLNVETRREVISEHGFRIRYCRKWLRHSVAPQLLRSLNSYIRWADVVHLTGVYNFPTFPTLLLCRALSKPLVWSPRGAFQRWNGSRRSEAKAVWDFVAMRLADLSGLMLHFTSPQEAQEVSSRFSNLSSVVVPNGIDVPAVLMREKQSSTLRLLFIGRLDPKKGIEALLQACSILAVTSQINWNLVIAGEGSPTYVSHLRMLAQELGISPRVSFLGEVLGDAKQQLFERSDVVVVPSHTENFAIVVAEALAHAAPVIASSGTPWSGLEAKGCGLWVSNAPSSLAAALHQISTMPLHEMGQRGREWMQSEFSWSSVSRQMLEVYQRIHLASAQASFEERSLRAASAQ